LKSDKILNVDTVRVLRFKSFQFFGLDRHEFTLADLKTFYDFVVGDFFLLNGTDALLVHGSEIFLVQHLKADILRSSGLPQAYRNVYEAEIDGPFPNCARHGDVSPGR